MLTAFVLTWTVAPVMEAVDYVEYDFDNAFDSKNIYRGPPTPERDAAWAKLYNRELNHSFPMRKSHDERHT
jgi:hypothetical protein